jgi:hypothetical protein
VEGRAASSIGPMAARSWSVRSRMIRLLFGSLNHVRGGTINPKKTIAADANTLISLPLSGAQPTWQGLLLVRPRS